MLKRTLSLTIIVCFFLTTLGSYPKAHADTVLGLPAPGTMINLSPTYEPVIIKGLTVHKDNPFLFDFIVDVGQDRMSGEPLKKEGEKLIKYFLASLAIPDKDVWVNLSPYEKDRMISEALGQTDMGRDLLEQDYILKQLTASLIYPEKQLGKVFWDKVYGQAQAMYGTTQIPVNTFNKVWIMADRAEVFEHNQTAFVVDQHLKVMLEEDYLALQKHSGVNSSSSVNPESSTVIPGASAGIPGASTVIPAKAGIQDTAHSIASQIVRQIILPQLEKEVNTGKNFANLRQIFNSIILSSWYKKNLKQALLNQVYANRSKVKGIDLNDPAVKQQIYEQYLKAYKKGVFNYIKEDVNTANGETMPRKYFSGGISVAAGAASEAKVAVTTDLAMGSEELSHIVPTDRAMVDVTALASPQLVKTGERKVKEFRYELIDNPGLTPEKLAEELGYRVVKGIKPIRNELESAPESDVYDLNVLPPNHSKKESVRGIVKSWSILVVGEGFYLFIETPDAAMAGDRTQSTTSGANDRLARAFKHGLRTNFTLTGREFAKSWHLDNEVRGVQAIGEELSSGRIDDSKLFDLDGDYITKERVQELAERNPESAILYINPDSGLVLFVERPDFAMINNEGLLALVRQAEAKPGEEESQMVELAGRSSPHLRVNFVDEHRFQFSQQVLAISESLKKQGFRLKNGIGYSQLSGLVKFNMDQRNWFTFLAIGKLLRYWDLTTNQKNAISIHILPVIDNLDMNRVISDALGKVVDLNDVGGIRFNEEGQPSPIAQYLLEGELDLGSFKATDVNNLIIAEATGDRNWWHDPRGLRAQFDLDGNITHGLGTNEQLFALMLHHFSGWEFAKKDPWYVERGKGDSRRKTKDGKTRPFGGMLEKIYPRNGDVVHSVVYVRGQTKDPITQEVTGMTLEVTGIRERDGFPVMEGIVNLVPRTGQKLEKPDPILQREREQRVIEKANRLKFFQSYPPTTWFEAGQELNIGSWPKTITVENENGLRREVFGTRQWEANAVLHHAQEPSQALMKSGLVTYVSSQAVGDSYVQTSTQVHEFGVDIKLKDSLKPIVKVVAVNKTDRYVSVTFDFEIVNQKGEMVIKGQIKKMTTTESPDALRQPNTFTGLELAQMEQSKEIQDRNKKYWPAQLYMAKVFRALQVNGVDLKDSRLDIDQENHRAIVYGQNGEQVAVLELDEYNAPFALPKGLYSQVAQYFTLESGETADTKSFSADAAMAVEIPAEVKVPAEVKEYTEKFVRESLRGPIPTEEIISYLNLKGITDVTPNDVEKVLKEMPEVRFLTPGIWWKISNAAPDQTIKSRNVQAVVNTLDEILKFLNEKISRMDSPERWKEAHDRVSNFRSKIQNGYSSYTQTEVEAVLNSLSLLKLALAGTGISTHALEAITTRLRKELSDATMLAATDAAMTGEDLAKDKIALYLAMGEAASLYDFKWDMTLSLTTEERDRELARYDMLNERIGAAIQTLAQQKKYSLLEGLLQSMNSDIEKGGRAVYGKEGVKIYVGYRDQIAKALGRPTSNAAMKVASDDSAWKKTAPGGIDLNTSSGMRWKVSKDGRGVEMDIDPAMIERIKREGVDSLSPVIFKITPVTSIWPLVGLQAPEGNTQLVKI